MVDLAEIALPEKGAERPDPMAFGRGLASGVGVNILVKDVEASIRWQAAVLGAVVIYWEDHFAIVRAQGSVWLVHSDWSYRDHEMTGVVRGVEARGAGVEIRLYGADPDDCEARAREVGGIVLAGSLDKPHGLREAYLVDPDGYIWVPGVGISG